MTVSLASTNLHADTLDAVDDDQGTVGDTQSGRDFRREVNVTCTSCKKYVSRERSKERKHEPGESIKLIRKGEALSRTSTLVPVVALTSAGFSASFEASSAGVSSCSDQTSSAT